MTEAATEVDRLNIRLILAIGYTVENANRLEEMLAQRYDDGRASREPEIEAARQGTHRASSRVRELEARLKRTEEMATYCGVSQLLDSKVSIEATKREQMELDCAVLLKFGYRETDDPITAIRAAFDAKEGKP